MKNLEKACPFEWGDKVDHKLFGLGTVNGEPVATYSADKKTHKTVSNGWTVPIQWDDENQKATRVGSFAITLVTRPDAKGGAYWNNEFKKLLNAVDETRSRTNSHLQMAFRLQSNSSPNALEALQHFISEDKKGNHP